MIKKYKTLNSLEDLRKEFGLKPIIKQTKDKNKLNSQREKFSSNNTCRICGQPLKLVLGTNVLFCENPECDGIRHEYVDEETEEVIVRRSTSFKTLDEKSAEIANNIFK